MTDISKLNAQIEAMRAERNSWWTHWKDLADFILPRRYRWLVTPNQQNRGSAINGKILDSTGTIAARVCASGMMSGVTSPTRPWFKLNIDDITSEGSNEVSLWLGEVERRMMRVFSESNFYNSMAVLYLDLVVFGSGCVLIYQDFDDVIRCHNPALGEFFFAVSDRQEVNTVGRELAMTVAQVVEKFGIENVSDSVRAAYNTGGASLSREVIVRHLIRPNTGELPKPMKFVECYWEASESVKYLRKTGFREAPFLGVRWDVTANDPYGRSPGMDALGDIKQLQQETLRKAQAIDKLVNPPMLADVQLKNQPASILPGGITYIAGQNNIGMKPIYQINPPVQEIMLDIQALQLRISNIFFNDLFQMISQLNTVRSATEIDARREEKLVLLGPVLERFENEALGKAIDRTFGIMQRGGLLPPAPEVVQGKPLQVQYVSMLSAAQSATATAAMERVIGLAGSISAVNPTVNDNINFDTLIQLYGSKLGTDVRIFNAPEIVAEVRARRAAKEQQIEQLAMTRAAVDGANVLSKTEVGGGINALQAITQGGNI